MYNDELYHHGILGQKWGKQNGPPYPLKASKHSAAEKKAGWKKSLSPEKEAKQYQNKLNAMDKGSDVHRRTIQDSYRTREGIKDWARQTGKYEQYDDGFAINFKPTKRDQNIAKEFLDAGKASNKAAKSFDKGQKEVNKAIKKLEKKGYTVSSKEVTRLSMNGKDYAELLGATLWATALVSAAGVMFPASAPAAIKGGAIGSAVALTNLLDQHKVKGYKYKVTPPKSK